MNTQDSTLELRLPEGLLGWVWLENGEGQPDVTELCQLHAPTEILHQLAPEKLYAPVEKMWALESDRSSAIYYASRHSFLIQQTFVK